MGPERDLLWREAEREAESLGQIDDRHLEVLAQPCVGRGLALPTMSRFA